MFDLKARHILRDALFLDVPYIVDSFCRHAEFRLNRLHRPQINAAPELKAYTALPAFTLLVIVLLFAAYGPTLVSLCGVLGAERVDDIRRNAGRFCVWLAWLQFFGSCIYFHFRIRRRFDKKDLPRRVRWVVVHIIFGVVLFVWALPLYYFGGSLGGETEHEGCRPQVLHWPATVQLAVLLIAALFAGWRCIRARTLGRRVAWQAVTILSVVLLLSSLPGIEVRTEAAQVPYPHVFGVVAVGFALISWLALWLVKIPFFSIRREDRRAVRTALLSVELFRDTRREDPELSPRRIFGGLVVGILQKPLQFLLLPSFAVLLVPEGFLWHACVGGVLASALLITAGTLTARWDQMSQYLRRYFLLGTPLVVSAMVIVIATLRLLGVQYATTILNVAPFGVLFVWMVMAYVLSWWFESQVNSVLAARLLWVLGARGAWDHELVRYRPRLCPPADLTRVELRHRYLTGHAMGSLVVVGQMLERSSGKLITAFEAYPYLEMFDALLNRANPDASHEMGRRVQLYFAMVNLLLGVGLGLLFWHAGRGDRLNTVSPVVSAQARSMKPASGASSPADLAALLKQDTTRPKPSALVVAASGGGTRAAMYTATVLEGLHKLNADSRIVLLSGVSGGGVAAAYFYGHRDLLLNGPSSRCQPSDKEDTSPYACFIKRMAMPFINDVLYGASEWRLQSGHPLGTLLAESFERRLFSEQPSDHGEPKERYLTLGADPSLGLILNTTISGQPLQDVPMLDGAVVRLPQTTAGPCEDFEVPVAALSGGRLAFTNLSDVSAFRKSSAQAPSIQMPFVLVRDPNVGLAQAAALNANFPPVFPNARVNIRGLETRPGECDVRSYFVTDGGAVENLSLVSALLAIDSALSDLEVRGDKARDIDVVLAEASALEVDYSQDRGVGAVTNESKERLTGRLTLELLERVIQRISPAKVTIHDLSLPRVFRTRGGFGTHSAVSAQRAARGSARNARPTGLGARRRPVFRDRALLGVDRPNAARSALACALRCRQGLLHSRLGAGSSSRSRHRHTLDLRQGRAKRRCS